MLELTIKPLEDKAVELLTDIGVFDQVTRRKLGVMPPKTGYFEANVTILPVEAEGSLGGGADVELRVQLRIAGRGVNGTAVLDGVRFRSDLALERLMSAEGLRDLWAGSDTTSWGRELEEVDGGAVVVVETANVTSSLLHVVGAGQAQGIVAAAHAGFGAGVANAELARPVVYHEHLDSVLFGVSANVPIRAVFAGADPGGAHRLELRNDGGTAVATFDIDTTNGIHEFPGQGAGEYTLTIIAVETGVELARYDRIRIAEKPE